MTPGAESDSAERPARGPRLLSIEKEDDLRARLAARDERALSELVELASPWLLGLAQSMLQEASDAEEVVLETFRVAWDQVPPPGQGPRGLLPWLFRITRNRAIDRLRSQKRRRRLGELVANWSATSDPAIEPDESAQPGWHVHATVHRALDELPEEQRRAIQLAYFEGQTHSEIGRQLGIPLGTVKTRLRLGLERLRTSLGSLKDWVV